MQNRVVPASAFARRARLAIASLGMSALERGGRGLVITGLVLAGFGCGGETDKHDAMTDNFDRSALLAHLATNVLLPIQEDVAAKAALVPAAIEAHCTALGSGTGDTTLGTARLAWQNAVDAWERADALKVGPAVMDALPATLRDRIYAWPAQAPCDTDRDVVTHFNAPASYDLTTKLGRQRSLTTIEYLLFPQTDMHSCVTEPPGWTALAANLPLARCRLALTLAEDVATAANELVTAWRADGGNYVGELAGAGTSASSIASAHAGVNLVSNSFFYVDRDVKDMKLAESAGLVMTTVCGVVGEPCVREVELRYADRATFAIRINLSALRQAVSGTTPTADGPGFDDFLIAVGQPDLAANMLADLDAAIAKASALPDSFLGALTSNYTAVVDTHAAIKQFTNDLKSQFLTVLALDIPDDVASDND
ncbi:MAG TPA: imelysin family protein [Kofleriaceae bacterium]